MLFVAAGTLVLLAPILLGSRVLRAARVTQGADSVDMTSSTTAVAA